MSMTDIVELLRQHATEDHSRRCACYSYSCDCGYELSSEGLLEIATDEIERLRAQLEKANDPTRDATSSDLDIEPIKVPPGHELCASCGRLFKFGDTCPRGGCPCGGDA